MKVLPKRVKNNPVTIVTFYVNKANIIKLLPRRIVFYDIPKNL